jgi:hypothetical protein
MLRMRRSACATIVLAMLFAMTPATAHADVTTQVTRDHSFFEIKSNGDLMRWTNSGGGYQGSRVGWGWGQTRLIAALSSTRLMEVKGDGKLSLWIDNGSGFHEFAEGDASTARLMIGLSESKFLIITIYNELWEYEYCQGFLLAHFVGAGWDASRALIGLGPQSFYEIKYDGDLIHWYWVQNCGCWQSIRLGWGWGTARLVAGITDDQFVEVKNNGDLAEWNWNYDHGGWEQTRAGWGWADAVLLG